LFDVVDFYKSCNFRLYRLGLSGIAVGYRQFEQCAFIFTEFFDDFTADQWKRYVYNDNYQDVDPGY